MRNSAITRIVIYSILILLLAGLLVGGISYHHNHGWAWVGEKISEELDFDDEENLTVAVQGDPVSVPAEEVREIQVDWVSGSVTLEPGDVDSIQLSETASKKPMAYSVKNGKLLIRFYENMKKITVGGNLEDKDLKIIVPRDFVGQELEIRTASAELLADSLTFEEVEFQGASGECEFVDCRIGELSLETASGDVNFTGSLRELDCDSMSADCELTLSNVPEEISMDAMSGDLELRLPADAGFTLDIDGMSKDMDTDFTVTARDGKFIAGDGKCQIDIDCMSGGAKIYMAK